MIGCGLLWGRGACLRTDKMSKILSPRRAWWSFYDHNQAPWPRDDTYSALSRTQSPHRLALTTCFQRPEPCLWSRYGAQERWAMLIHPRHAACSPRTPMKALCGLHADGSTRHGAHTEAPAMACCSPSKNHSTLAVTGQALPTHHGTTPQGPGPPSQGHHASTANQRRPRSHDILR